MAYPVTVKRPTLQSQSIVNWKNGKFGSVCKLFIAFQESGVDR